MTQQLDLALNMTNTTDKMMSNSTLSYSNKDSKDLNNQFGSFLDSANKTYTNSSKTNDTKYENNNKVSSNRNERKDVKSDKKEQSSVKTNDKQSNKSNIQESKSDANTVSDTKVNEQSDIQVVSTEEFVQAETIEEVENIDEILEESILTANISDAVKMVSSDAISTIETTTMLTAGVEMELPTDAINSGIQFEANLTDVDVEGADVNTVDSITQNMNVSKEDTIASLYATNVQDKDVKQQIQGNEKVSDKFEDLNLNVEKTEVKDVEEKVEIVSDVKISENVSDKTDIKAEVKTDEIFDKTEKLDIEKTNVNVSDDEKAVKLVKDSDTEKEVVVQDKTEIQQDKQIDDTQQIQNVDLKEQDVKVELSPVMEKVSNTEQKVEEFKQEIHSAKLENVANNVQVKTDKKSVDENAKTNIETDETMDIKEDVSGIEFVNNNKVVEDTKKDLKTNDTHVEKVKQKVEDVKIQVEEDVKINPQLVKTTEDVNNVAKAQETLNKSGLTTENLQKMDAKIKDIDYSHNNAQTDLGQSSQEMFMRDVMQESAQNTSSEAVELKVDFNQNLNKVLQANSGQQNIQAQEELPEVNILDQIRTKFAASSQNGMQKITIGLTPESLGKLHIEISKGMNGLSAQIVAENPQAKEILDKNLDGLRSALQSQGVNVNNVNVKVAEASRSSDSNNNLFNSENGQFNSNNNGDNSKNSGEGEREKRAEYEYLQQEAIKNENVETTEESVERNAQTGKTVSIKGSTGNVKYQL